MMTDVTPTQNRGGRRGGRGRADQMDAQPTGGGFQEAGFQGWPQRGGRGGRSNQNSMDVDMTSSGSS